MGGGLSSQGMQTTNYTYHLREGKRAPRGGPRSRQRKEEGVIEPQAALRCPGSQPGIPPHHFSVCLVGDGGDENAS